MIIAALVNRATAAELISPCLHTRSVLAQCDYEIEMAAFSHGRWGTHPLPRYHFAAAGDLPGGEGGGGRRVAGLTLLDCPWPPALCKENTTSDDTDDGAARLGNYKVQHQSQRYIIYTWVQTL